MAHLKKNASVLVTSTIKAVNDFFESVFNKVDAEENKSVTYEDKIIFFKLWAEFILSTGNDADNLQKHYAEKFAPISSKFDNEIVEGVIVQFKNKIKKDCRAPILNICSRRLNLLKATINTRLNLPKILMKKLLLNQKFQF